MKDYCGRGGRRTSNAASWGGASRGRQSAIQDRAEAESYLHVAYMHSPLEVESLPKIEPRSKSIVSLQEPCIVG
jgi:hypothetical protein